MDISCPECQKNNTLKIEGENLVCEHCKKTVGQIADVIEHKTKKAPMPTILVVILSAGSSWWVTDHFLLHRYPLKTEYALIESCADKSDIPLTLGSYKKKKEICLCALAKTQKEVSYLSYKHDQRAFYKEFENSVWKCM